MPIQQIAYDIPNDIALGIAKGMYKRFGGVVRNADTGAIVKHLKEVPVPEKKAGNAVLQAVKNHPVATIGIGLAVAAGTAGTAYYVSKKEERELKKNSPKCVVEFDKTLKKYLKAVRKGTLQEKDIDDLLKSIDEVRTLGDEEHIRLDLSSGELKQLVNMIYDYTKRLAKANDVKLDRFKSRSHDPIVDLEGYLKIQKEIFKEVA